MIPFATTKITVGRIEGAATDSLDPYDPYDGAPPAATAVATGIRAVIGPPSASDMLTTGDRVEYSASMRCDVCDLQSRDVVTETDGSQWVVLWSKRVKAFGADFMHAELRMVQGAQ